jgi:hypothetical protein
MAFGISAIKAYGIETAEPVRGKFIQVLELGITAAAADVALDIGASGGTFWTSVNNSTIRNVVLSIFPKVQRHLSLSCPELYAKTLIRSGASTSGNDYKITSPQNTSFAITIHTGEGLTAYNLTMTWALKDNELPVVYSA